MVKKTLSKNHTAPTLQDECETAFVYHEETTVWFTGTEMQIILAAHGHAWTKRRGEDRTGWIMASNVSIACSTYLQIASFLVSVLQAGHV
jgi:hypothetical protein